MRYLAFEFSEGAQGPVTIEALASTGAAQHAAVLAEVEQVLAWAWTAYPHGHGAVDDGADWDHDLQVTVEAGGWHAVALTLGTSERFARDFLAEFGATATD